MSSAARRRCQRNEKSRWAICHAHLRPGPRPGQHGNCQDAERHGAAARNEAAAGIARAVPASSRRVPAVVPAGRALFVQPACGLRSPGRIVEVASGQTFDRFLKTRSSTPLDMTNTSFAIWREQPQRLALIYRRRPAGPSDLPIRINWSATCIFREAPGSLVRPRITSSSRSCCSIGTGPWQGAAQPDHGRPDDCAARAGYSAWFDARRRFRAQRVR